MGKVAETVQELIGETPLVRLRLAEVPPATRLYAKLEYFNPGGSVKDRIGVEMLERALATGQLQPGGTIVEPTAGNTGVGLALAAAGRGFRVIFTMPEKFAGEKADLMRALGAEVVLTPNADGMMGAIDKAQALAATIANSYVPNQFYNQANPDAHYQTTGAEIWRDLEGRVDALVAGCGTGGTFSGVARYLKERNPAVRCYAVEPEGSTIGGGPKGSYKVEGIGNWFVPGTMHTDLAERFIQVSDRESFAWVRRLAREAGLLVGSSSGAAVAGAVRVCAELPPGSTVVTIFPDSGERYLSKHIYDETEA